MVYGTLGVEDSQDFIFFIISASVLKKKSQ